MRCSRLACCLLLMALSGQAQAWWSNPYGYFPGRTGYWPGVWPAYVTPQYRTFPYDGWNVKGAMNENGDAHFVFEFHGNIYDMPFGNRYGYAYPWYQNRNNGWRY